MNPDARKLTLLHIGGVELVDVEPRDVFIPMTSERVFEILRAHRYYNQTRGQGCCECGAMFGEKGKGTVERGDAFRRHQAEQIVGSDG